jgi:hypothetical protein
MDLETGNSSQVPSIANAGGEPVQVSELTPAVLQSLGVLYVQNPNNSGFSQAYTSSMAAIQSAVEQGMVLVIHDRAVTNAASILPGGAGFDIRREFSDDRNIEILDNTTLVTNGPGGLVTNTSLDNGSSSSHGFAVLGTLPGNSRNILARTNPGHIVTFCYAVGQGAVIYSSIPLDYYLRGEDTAVARNMRSYATNVVAWALSGACAPH